jgi:hypothetical protein
MPFCPECGAEYPQAVVACPRCRVVLVAEPEPALGEGDADSGEIVQRVPDAASGALLCGLLEHHGIPALLRSAMLPGYPGVGRDWSTSAWGEILVPRSDAERRGARRGRRGKRARVDRTGDRAGVSAHRSPPAP